MKVIRQYDMDQQMLLPPDLREWLRADHLALYVSDLVDQLDLGGIMRAYEEKSMRGRPPHHPRMMVVWILDWKNVVACTGAGDIRQCGISGELEAEVAEMLKSAERIDDEEDKLYGKGRRGDELPEELQKCKTRLVKIREAKAELAS